MLACSNLSGTVLMCLGWLPGFCFVVAVSFLECCYAVARSVLSGYQGVAMPLLGIFRLSVAMSLLGLF